MTILPIFILFLCELSRSSFIWGVLPNRANILTLAVVGEAIGAHLFIDTLSKLWIGWLLDHFSKRTVVVGSLLVSLISLLELGRVTNPTWVIVWCAAFGLGTSSIWMFVMYQATTLSTDQARHFMSKVYTAWFIAVGIGFVMGKASVLIASPLMNTTLYIGWSLAILLSLWLPNIKTSNSSNPFHLSREFRNETIRNAWFAIPGMFLQTLSAGAVLTTFQTYLKDNLALSLRHQLLLGAALGISLLFGLSIMGKIPKLPYRLTLSAGMFIVGAALFIVGLTSHLQSLLILSVVIGIFYAVVLSSWNAFLLSIVPKQNQGLGWGIFSMIEGAGTAAGTFLGGLLGNYFGITSTFTLSAIVLLFLSFWYFPYRQIKR